jgi:hypothetical protein
MQRPIHVETQASRRDAYTICQRRGLTGQDPRRKTTNLENANNNLRRRSDGSGSARRDSACLVVGYWREYEQHYIDMYWKPIRDARLARLPRQKSVAEMFLSGPFGEFSKGELEEGGEDE